MKWCESQLGHAIGSSQSSHLLVMIAKTTSIKEGEVDDFNGIEAI